MPLASLTATPPVISLRPKLGMSCNDGFLYTYRIDWESVHEEVVHNQLAGSLADVGPLRSRIG